ncbi:hypothetical protein MTO96_037540, partial [Rhipicephalus appendiculatus]
NLVTLEELEVLLYVGAVAPCVPRESTTLDSIVYSNRPRTLGKKLYASLLKHRD